MIKELETVVLTVDVDEYNLKIGDVGAVVMVYGQGEAYEVEFVTYNGETVALVTLTGAQIRRIQAREMPHVRAFNVA